MWLLLLSHHHRKFCMDGEFVFYKKKYRTKTEENNVKTYSLA